MAGNSNSDPVADFAAITPHDSNQIIPPFALYVGVGGDIVAVNRSGQTITFKGVPTGAILPIRPKILKATGTTATDIVGLG